MYVCLRGNGHQIFNACDGTGGYLHTYLGILAAKLGAKTVLIG